MKSEEFTLELNGTCIECTSKKQLGAISEALMFDDTVDVVKCESDYNFLLQFLRSTDFKKMRSENEILDGNYKLTVKVVAHSDNEFEVIPLSEPVKINAATAETDENLLCTNKEFCKEHNITNERNIK